MSTEVTTEMMNEVIARFMDYKSEHQGHRRPHPTLTFRIDNIWWPVNALKYHTSWDWLMPVVKKIEDMPTSIRIENEPGQMDKNYLVTIWIDPEDEPLIQTCDCSKLTAVYNAVYQFITWYNEYQQKQNNE